MDDILRKHKEEKTPVLHMRRREWFLIKDFRHNAELNTFEIEGTTCVTREKLNCYVEELEFIPVLEPEALQKPSVVKQDILGTISDLCSDFLYYDRKEDETLSAEQLNEAVVSGEITVDEMVAEFRKHLENTFST